VYLSQLSLTDFRSYTNVDLDLESGVTAFIGPNGQGKTNLVEAVAYLATLGSHRVATDAPLIRAGAERAIVRGAIMRDGRPSLIELEITAGKANRARINRSPVRGPREVLGVLRTVVFAPEDLAIVKGDPSGRRRFLDDLLVARAPRFAGVRSDYERVLKQRNALLKSAGSAVRASRARSSSVDRGDMGGSASGGGAPDLRTLDVWDGHLARAGADLIAARLELVAALRPLVGAAYETVARTDDDAKTQLTQLDYKSSVRPDDDAADRPGLEQLVRATDGPASGTNDTTRVDRDLLTAMLLESISRARTDEIERGISLVGPHRDDLVLTLGELPAKGYASQGESWSFALALRLAAYDLLRAGGDDPVLILDDVFAELDTDRRDRLAELVADCEQVLITAAVPQDVPDLLDGARCDVMDGAVRRVL
jgi:DNA replication and repair protein RecF